MFLSCFFCRWHQGNTELDLTSYREGIPLGTPPTLFQRLHGTDTETTFISGTSFWRRTWSLPQGCMTNSMVSSIGDTSIEDSPGFLRSKLMLLWWRSSTPMCMIRRMVLWGYAWWGGGLLDSTHRRWMSFWGLQSSLLRGSGCLLTDVSLLVKLLWRLDLWTSMRSFNGDFPPWRCSRR